ncbi:hypothetical protein [Fontivita pretiosa]|uniref:hypothetical protein n=1 Tax=Fontivita pretiosa TaxID=2989684 RepID=UPI003D16ADA8
MKGPQARKWHAAAREHAGALKADLRLRPLDTDDLAADMHPDEGRFGLFFVNRNEVLSAT